ncbi:hypothetical protein BDA99DRAFT_560832 [Phascolomyces articulosus]|uniref:G domain-containing protein n=1 Tax=Phascolomyces articulosus TaxID=60185 RepID=A0AAD5K963_9FUNG|nr:hypothetical protein BDA99DRAFT_560832 [Phascolomyces articulosus]
MAEGRFLSTSAGSTSSPVSALVLEGDCPGCGAPFQAHDPKKPGYYIERSNIDRESNVERQKQRKRSNNSMSDAEFKAAVDALDPELRTLLEEGGSSFKQFEKKMIQQQQQHPTDNGSFPITTDKSKEDFTKPAICQRCYSLAHYNRITTDTSPTFLRATQQYGSLEFLRTKHNPLIVVVLDMTDLPFSLGSQLLGLIQDNPTARVLIAANKVDMIPQRARCHEQRIRDWIVQYLKQQRFPTKQIKGISLVSAKKGWGVLNLLQRIGEERLPTDDVYLVGSTNVGKSALVNNILIQRASKDKRQQYHVTSSAIPGTTMGALRIPLHALHMGSSSPRGGGRRLIERDHYLIDTPGVINDQQLIHLMPFKEQKKLMRQKEFKPITFRLEAGRSLLLDSFVRIDVMEASNPVLFTLFTHMIPHITKTLKLMGKDSSLEPIPQLLSVQGTHKSRAAVDFAFANIGWIAVAGLFDKARFRIWLPNGVNPSETFAIREPAMLPFEYQGVIRKFFGSGERARK